MSLHIYFIISFILFSIPPFYIWIVKNAFFQTHSVGKYIFLIIFIRLLFDFSKKREEQKKTYSFLQAFLILIYFISQSISVFNAYNIQAFLGIYQYIFFGLLAFFISSHLFKTEKSIIILFQSALIIVFFHVIYEFVLYFFPQSFLLFKAILYERYWEAIFIGISRGKFFLDIYDSVFIPFLLYMYFQSKKTYIKFGIVFLVSVIIFFSFLSNFKTSFLLSLFSLSFSLFYFYKNIRKKSIWIFIVSAIISCIFAFKIANKEVGYNVVQRFVSSPEKAGFASVEDIISRPYLWKKALEFGLSSPIIGIGLGNFYDYMPQSKNPGVSLFDWRNDLIRASSQHPHNIFLQTFAESGFFGAFSFLSLIIFFIIKDFFVLRRSFHIPGVLIISFWTLFIFALFHGSFILQYLILFWSLRGALNNVIERFNPQFL